MTTTQYKVMVFGIGAVVLGVLYAWKLEVGVGTAVGVIYFVALMSLSTPAYRVWSAMRRKQRR